MTSPKDPDLPSLLAWGKSAALILNEPDTILLLGAVPLIRGATAAPQAAEVVCFTEETEGARDGKAVCDSVSRLVDALLVAGRFALGSSLPPRDGKGSGAPSSSCLRCREEMNSDIEGERAVLPEGRPRLE